MPALPSFLHLVPLDSHVAPAHLYSIISCLNSCHQLCPQTILNSSRAIMGQLKPLLCPRRSDAHPLIQDNTQPRGLDKLWIQPSVGLCSWTFILLGAQSPPLCPSLSEVSSSAAK